MIQLQELDHFGIEVSDLNRARAFYVDFLGMEFLQSLGPDGLLLRCGSRNVALHRKPGLPPPSPDRVADPLGKAHHAFKVSGDDFKLAIEGFAERGIPHHGPVDWGDHDCLYFLDPDGNLLEIVWHR
jgi:catechol 2,3-dioxygenase-like lactoylglutathione lyase family enzyme